MPITRLSKANIRRARRIIRGERKYRSLSARRKNLLTFRVAWTIQKGHVKRLGHR